jgi:phage/plasmid-like protein (TIGR03299 family)
MGEPYDARECPACGSNNTGSYSYSAYELGFGSRCYTCQATWEFPGNISPEEVMRWSASVRRLRDSARKQQRKEASKMPANVESMFSVRQMPWHREGIILEDYPGDWAQARKLAGLDWDPITTEVYALTDLNANGTPRYEPINGWKCIARSDDGAVLSLNRDTYTVISHGEMGEIVEAVLAQPNVQWETAGVLDGGRAVWCLAMLDEPISLPGDASPTLPYLAITNRHDGTGSCALRATAVRIVCANTFRAAELEGERTGATFSFIHKSSWRNRIEEARQAVTGARREMRRYTELAAELLAIPITPRQRNLFITEFIPMPPQGLVTDRVARNVDEARTALRLLFDSTTNEQIAGTAYGLVQAAGEYLDHVRTARSWETRLNRTLIRPEPLKHRALSLVREITTA